MSFEGRGHGHDEQMWLAANLEKNDELPHALALPKKGVAGGGPFGTVLNCSARSIE